MAATRSFRVHHAAELSGPLPSSSRCVFYTHTLCPYAQRVFLTLLCKHVPFELVQVDLSDKPHWYHSINPHGLVPAVSYKGISHTESMDICRWLDQEYAQPSLTPSQAAARQEMDKLLSQASSIIDAGLTLTAGSTARSWGVGRSPSRTQQQRFEAQCKQLTSALQKTGGPYLTGATPSLADVALLPFFERFYTSMLDFQDYDLRALHDGSLAVWMDNLGQQEWCKMAAADKELLKQAIRKHESLDFFDYMSYKAWACHPHLR